MTLYPYDVHSTQFRVVLRGYAVEEVDRFLDEVEATLVALRSAPSQPRPPKPQQAAAPDSAALAVRTLQLAEETADRLTAESQACAAALVAQAHRQAEEIVAVARAEAKGIAAEIAELETVERTVRARLRSALSEQLVLLDRSVDPGPGTGAGVQPAA